MIDFSWLIVLLEEEDIQGKYWSISLKLLILVELISIRRLFIMGMRNSRIILKKED